MVYLEGPGGEEFFRRDTGYLYDHERLARDRFRCPVCDAPLELLESAPDDRDMSNSADESCKLIAACRLCDVTFTQDDWHSWMDERL
jgi:hypothetical protein